MMATIAAALGAGIAALILRGIRVSCCLLYGNAPMGLAFCLV